MKLLVLLIVISIVAFQLIARGAEINADYGVSSTPADSIDDPSAGLDGLALSKDASEILTRMTDFISAASAFSLVSDTGHEVMHKNG